MNGDEKHFEDRTVRPALFRGHPGIVATVLLLLGAAGGGYVFVDPWIGWVAVVPGFIWLCHWITVKTTSLTLAGTRIRYQAGWVARVRHEIRADRVRSTMVHQSVSQRLLGVGTLAIHTAGDEPEVVIGGIPDPVGVREDIGRRMEGSSVGA